MNNTIPNECHDDQFNANQRRNNCWMMMFIFHHNPIVWLLQYKSNRRQQRCGHHVNCDDDNDNNNNHSCPRRRRRLFHGTGGWWKRRGGPNQKGMSPNTPRMMSKSRKVPSSPDVTALISYEEMGNHSSNSSSNSSNSSDHRSHYQIKIPHMFTSPSLTTTSNPTTSLEYSNTTGDGWTEEDNPTKILFPYWESVNDSREEDHEHQKQSNCPPHSHNKLRILLNDKIRFNDDGNDSDESSTDSDMISGFLSIPAATASHSYSSVSSSVIRKSHSMKSAGTTTAKKLKETTKQLLCACSSSGTGGSHNSNSNHITAQRTRKNAYTTTTKMKKSKHHQKVGSTWGDNESDRIHDNNDGDCDDEDKVVDDEDLCSYNFSISSDRDSSSSALITRPVKIQVVTETTNNHKTINNTTEYEEEHPAPASSSTTEEVKMKHSSSSKTTKLESLPVAIITTDVPHPVNVYVTTHSEQEQTNKNRMHESSHSLFLPTTIAWPDDDLSSTSLFPMMPSNRKGRSSSISLDEFMNDTTKGNSSSRLTETIVFCHKKESKLAVPSINLGDVSAADSASVGSNFLSVSYDDEYPQLVLRDSNNISSITEYDDDFFRTLSVMHDDFFNEKRLYSSPQRKGIMSSPPKLGIAFGHPKASCHESSSSTSSSSSSSSSSVCSYMIPTHRKEDIQCRHQQRNMSIHKKKKKKKGESLYMSWLNQKIDQVLDQMDRDNDEVGKKEVISRLPATAPTTMQTQSSSEWEERDDANWSFFQDDDGTSSMIEFSDSHKTDKKSNRNTNLRQRVSSSTSLKDPFEPILKPIIRFVVATQLPAPSSPPKQQRTSNSSSFSSSGSKKLASFRIHPKNNAKKQMMVTPPLQQLRQQPLRHENSHHPVGASKQVTAFHLKKNSSTSRYDNSDEIMMKRSPPRKPVLTTPNVSKYTVNNTPHSPYRCI